MFRRPRLAGAVKQYPLPSALSRASAWGMAEACACGASVESVLWTCRVEAPVGRDPKERKRMAVVWAPGANARPAASRYKLKATLANGAASLVEWKLARRYCSLRSSRWSLIFFS